MKRKYIMLSLLISGPKQPGNDIDVYLVPLLEDLNKLWKDGVMIFDVYLKEYFILHAVIFCTINDFPGYGNLSGHRTKGAKRVQFVGEETHTIRLKNLEKNIYLGHRRFLNQNHPYRRKKKTFDGKVELEKTPISLSGK
jgi:Transposase family tnp2